MAAGLYGPLPYNLGVGLYIGAWRGVLLLEPGPASVEETTEASRLSPCGTPAPSENMLNVASGGAGVK